MKKEEGGCCRHQPGPVSVVSKALKLEEEASTDGGLTAGRRENLTTFFNTSYYFVFPERKIRIIQDAPAYYYYYYYYYFRIPANAPTRTYN